MPLVKKNGVIGIAGVSSTGKTTLCQELKLRYPDKFVVHNKISRREQLDWAGLDSATLDLNKESNETRKRFDLSRVSYQAYSEEMVLNGMRADGWQQTLVCDGCVPSKLAYMMAFSGSLLTEKELEDTFKFGIEFSQRFYDTIIYLPVGRIAFQPAEHRTFTSPYMLDMMDDVLRGILYRHFSAQYLEIREHSMDKVIEKLVHLTQINMVAK